MSDLLFGPTATWFTIPAIVGTAFFLGRMVLMAIGGADADAGGFDGLDGADVFDGDAGLDDSGDAFEILSLQAIAAFMMGFGWGGLAAWRGSGLPLSISLVVAVVIGIAMVWILAKVLRFVMSLQSSGTLPLYHALEATGTVYAEVPAEGSGTGEVRVVIGNRERYLFATTKGEALPRDTAVRVVAIDADANRVEVVRA
ncbi:MAG TPA: hypothetical protein VJ925_05300 [Longimicrobiales bacterium]|nr:hypothetical protein [Longimicrobiales bacterium]